MKSSKQGTKMSLNKEKTLKSVKKIAEINKKYIWGILAVLAVVCLLADRCYMSGKVHELQTWQKNVQQQLDEAKNIYVFNLEKVVAASDLVSIQQEFEQQVLELSNDVEKAKKKIAGLKKSKVNEDFSDVYLKSLTFKRDELVAKHEKQMAQITNQINEALNEVAKQKKASVIFNLKAISVSTKHVIDVSDEVIEKIKELSAKAE